MHKIKNIVSDHYEAFSYLFFGVCTTGVNWIVYSLLVTYSPIGVNPSNIIAWIVSVIFAFCTNKIFVFKSINTKGGLLAKEFCKFVSSRMLTGVLEIGLLPLLIYLGFDQRLFGIEGFAAKLLISVVVVILNYVLSKNLVFKKQ